MTSDVLVDVDVVFAAMLDGHPAHDTAAGFIRNRAGGEICFALPVQLGVLRLLSTVATMGGSALPPPRALAHWDAFVAAARMREVTAPAQMPGHFERVLRQRKPSPNLWNDAWLAALCLALDLEVATFDRGFRSFAGLRLALLTA